MMWNRLGAAVLVAALALSPARAQTLPLPAGTGFIWERVGDVGAGIYLDLTFDADGTLWDSNSPPRWLDRSQGGAGRWVIPDTPNPRPDGNAILALGPHPPGGPARADTLVITFGYTRRSTDGGATYQPWTEAFNWALAEIPPGVPHARRVLVGNEGGYSDDRGATWTPATRTDAGTSIFDFLVLPAPNRLPGAASGRPTGAPTGWPGGRVVAGTYGGTFVGGVSLSDDGGASYRPSALNAPGRTADVLALVRWPDTHPLGAGPRLLTAGNLGGSSYSVWSSDDGGETWQFRAYTPEPRDGPGGGPEGLFALSETGESDPGAGGAAVLVLGRGHIYRTDDGGETWRVAGRTPQTGEVEPDGGTYALVTASAVGPDGRLYVGVSYPINRGWVWRTAGPLAVAGEAQPVPAEAAGLDVSVRPNPAGGRVEVALALAAAAAVRVTVVDALGREVVVVLDGPVGAGETVRGVETASWPAGVYVVRATAGAQTVTARLVVAR